MKKMNRVNFWENELQKYGEFGKNSVGASTPTLYSAPKLNSVNSASNSKSTESKNPLAVYNAYIGGKQNSDGIATYGATAADANPNNKFSAKYQGTNFLDWYKTNYGKDYDSSTELSRGEGMSDVDWAIGSSLYDTYRNNQQRQSDYESRIASLDKSKSQSQQNASIAYDKLKKYLPVQIKAQGLGGLGVSESSLLNAYNEYASKLGSIENDYQDRRSSLEEAYSQDNLQSWLASKDNVEGIFSGYQTQFENAQRQTYQDAVNTISQSVETDESKILDYVEQLKNHLSDDGYLDLVRKAKQKAQDNQQTKLKEDKSAALDAIRNRLYLYQKEGDYVGGLAYLEKNKDLFGADSQEYQAQYNDFSTGAEAQKKKEADEETKSKQEETDTRIIEGKEDVSYEGGTYRIKSQLDNNANEIAHNRDFTKQLQEKFGTTNPYDTNIPNGTVLAIKCDSNGANEVNWKDFVPDVTDWRDWVPFYNIYNKSTQWGNFLTRYVVYYNGNWYSADKK